MDGPRLVPPVIQCARRAFLERDEEGLFGSSSLLDILMKVRLWSLYSYGRVGSSVAVVLLPCYHLLGIGSTLWVWLVLSAGLFSEN